jgi:hypothetical protein
MSKEKTNIGSPNAPIGLHGKAKVDFENVGHSRWHHTSYVL